MRWLLLTVASVTVSVATFATAFQVSEEQPWNTVLIQVGPVSSLWLDPWLLLAGVATAILALVGFAKCLRWADRRAGQDD